MTSNADLIAQARRAQEPDRMLAGFRARALLADLVDALEAAGAERDMWEERAHAAEESPVDRVFALEERALAAGAERDRLREAGQAVLDEIGHAGNGLDAALVALGAALAGSGQ